MTSYNTLPVAANPDEVLLQKPKKTSLRYLVGGAALAALRRSRRRLYVR